MGAASADRPTNFNRELFLQGDPVSVSATTRVSPTVSTKSELDGDLRLAIRRSMFLQTA